VKCSSDRTSQAAAGNGIFVAGDRRPKTCLRDETYAQRRKSRPHRPLTSLEDQIENVQLKLQRMGRVAETGRDFAAIADVEARELVPLLVLRALRAILMLDLVP
jgi:hypothetical protein